MGISVQKTNAAILYPCPVMFWFLCALSYFAISADGVKSTCNAGSFRMGEEARITCRFEEDISKTQHDVRLFYNTTPVLVIAWSNGSPEIHTKHGYQFDGKINDTLTLEIPEAKLDQAGLYACHIVLSDATDSSACMLNVTATLYTTTAMEACPAICSTPCSFNNSTSNEERSSVYLVGVIITVCALTFVIIIIFIYFCRMTWRCPLPCCVSGSWKRRKKNKFRKKNKNLEERKLGLLGMIGDHREEIILSARKDDFKDTLHRNFDNTLNEIVSKAQERDSAATPITVT